MASSVFSGILRHHFQMNEDYVFDQFQDLLSTEEELIEALNDVRITPDAKTPVKHRKRLIEWMINLSDELKLGYKTRHMAIILVDLCLSKLKIHTNFLQLLGVTCIFISIKCEESFIYTLKNACDHCANCYTREQVGAMEMLIYKTLKWKLHYPTPGEIARRLVHITSAISFEGMPHFLKKVDSFIDLCLFENELSEYQPSCIAAVSILIAFGGSTAHVEGWCSLIKENNILGNLDKINTLYQNVKEEILKQDPSYFESAVMILKEKPAFRFIGQSTINQTHFVEFDHEVSPISFGSQETFVEVNAGDVTLESSSALGTPLGGKKEMPEDFRASLLDTEKLIKESPKKMQDEKDERRNSNSNSMEIEEGPLEELNK